jgi:hypothetical protein
VPFIKRKGGSMKVKTEMKLGHKITNPMSVKGTKEHVSTVLRVLAGKNNCDGSPYDQMQEAAEYIDFLEKMLYQKEKGKRGE